MDSAEVIRDAAEVTSAVLVKDAYKKFGRTIVLKGLNMNVPKGTIYGLLGPSGCGKTTLLSCMVALRTLDSGSITLGVKTKADIGYMPQDLGLFTELSIWETVHYYGTVFGLSTSEIADRAAKLLSFLDLPSKNRVINSLSGGQQRRVSLCVALLHDPEILILDEPTVGADPLISHSIWQKLLHMSTVDKKTIIITTHYIEEARAANTIGLMRGGVLLAEDDPERLIVANGSQSLEQVFLSLSYRQSGGSFMDKYRRSLKEYPKTDKRPTPPLTDNSGFNVRRVKAQILKNSYWMKRNIPIMGFLLMLPFMQCVFFNLTFGRDPVGLKVGVVNQELSNWSEACSGLPKPTCYGYPLSCLYLSKLKEKQMALVEYGDVASAKEGVRKNSVWGAIHFEANYSDNVMERYDQWLAASSQALDDSQANVWLDMSNQYIGNLIKWDLYRSYIDFLKDLFGICDWPIKAADIPVSFQDAVYGENRPMFLHFAVPAILQLFIFYLPMMFTVGALLFERQLGTLERCRVAGLTLEEIFVAHLFVQTILLVFQTLIMMLVMFVMFDNPLHGSISLCLLLLFLIAMMGTCYGVFVGVFCISETSATYMGLGSFFPLAMLSGMVWPYEGMHATLRSVGFLLPLTLTTESMRSILIRSWGLDHPTVYIGFISALCWIAVLLLLTVVVIRYKSNSFGKISQ